MKHSFHTLSIASPICALALASLSFATEAPQYGTFSGAANVVVGQPFATVPTTLGDGTTLRIGYWNGPAEAPLTTSIRAMPRPALAPDGWLRLSRTRLDLDASAAATHKGDLSEIDAARCTESPDCIGLSVKLEKPQRLDITIYDQLGVLVCSWSRHFDKNEITLRGAGNDAAWLGLGWNGRSTQGRVVGSGVYLVRVSKQFDQGDKLEEILKVGIRSR